MKFLICLLISIILPFKAAGAELNLSDIDLSLPIVSDTKVILTPKEKNALALQRAYQDRNVPAMLTENGRVTYAFGLTMPSVVCAPYNITDIELQQGELVNDVILGDTIRWKLTLARAGNPETSHIIVKPLDSGLETTAIITTDKRVYHLQLKSQAKGHMSYVGFVYPEDAVKTLQTQITSQRKRENMEKADLPVVGRVDLSSLSFAYEIKGSASFKPVQIFNDGRQTFIKMPPNLSELPVLLVRRDGGDILVNYRVKDNTLVVDDLFSEAILLAGVGSSQKKITIRKI